LGRGSPKESTMSAQVRRTVDKSHSQVEKKKSNLVNRTVEFLFVALGGGPACNE